MTRRPRIAGPEAAARRSRNKKARGPGPEAAARRTVAVAFAVALAACAGVDDVEVDAASYDPFGALDGKADGANDFFGQDRAWRVTITSDSNRPDEVDVAVAGPDAEADYDRASLRDWATSGDAARGTRRVRLRRRDSLAGMRSFLLRPIAAGESGDRLLDQGLLYAAVGLAAPRTVRATVMLDGEDLGDHLLIEHVGDRFLDWHFDTSEGDVNRTGDSAAASVLAERIGAEDATPWHLASVLDVEATMAALAVQSVTGPGPLAFYDPCDGAPRPCLVPIPEVGANVVDVAALADTLLSQTAPRRSWTDTLASLADCFDADECGTDADAARRVQELLTREYGANAPTGTTDYAPFTHIEGDDLQVAFRNVAGLPATAVKARVFGDASAGPETAREVALSYDHSENLWTAVFEATGPFSYDFVVEGPDGETEARVDPATTTSESRSRLTPESVDQLTEVARVRLDVREPSGLAMFGSRLFVIGDEADDVFEVDPTTGEILDRIDVDVRGIEGLAIDPVLGELYVADEDRGLLLRFSPEGEELSDLYFEWADDAGGIEGLTMRARDGHLFFAKERSPTRIAEVTPQDELLRRPRISWAPDISALAHSADDDRLYALSDEDQRLYRLDDDFEVTAYWDLDLDKPEGLVIHEGRVYIVSDSTRELVTYELNRGRWVP